MYNLTFTKNDLDLIGECVLQTIRDLRSASEKICVQDATNSLETTILRCGHILRELAKVQEGEE